ncbi:MAG: succinate dehydrogenase, cytochrome b556 subunit [Chloroflexota bacterium]|nr:succinate dehydrogenase, cytochrome b556 subunit [Chloroflexota bacterium]
MASITTGRARSGYEAMVPSADRLAWYFLRLSGGLLVILALTHMFITHYLNVPSETTFDFVANRWANPLWRTFDWVLLMAALWHGLIGLRYSVTDYIRRAGWRVFALSLVWITGLVFTGMGSITIFTFDEAAARENTGPLAGQIWIAQAIGGSLFVFAIGTYLGALALALWVARSLRAGGLPIYSGDPGQYAWVMHRATGIGIVFFLLVHIIDIMLIGLGRDVYDESVEFYGNVFLIPMEIALVGAVIYHTLNGLRIMAIDFWEMGTRRQRQLFWTALIGSVLLTIPSAIIIFLAEL